MENEQKITVDEAVRNKLRVLRQFEIVNQKNKKEIESILRDAIARHPGRDIEIVLDQAAFDIIHKQFNPDAKERKCRAEFNPVKVRVVETGKVYESQGQCAKELGVSTGDISRCLSGTRKTCRGYHFEKVN